MTVTSATGKGSTSPPHPRVFGSGFTLIELLVVLAIIVLLSSSFPLAINRMVPARRVTVTANQLIDDIRWLQHRCIGSGKPQRLELVEYGYRLGVDDADMKIVRLAKSTTVELQAFGSGLPAEQFTVYPDGTTSGGRFEIFDSGRHATLEVAMLTGRARRTR